MEELTSVNSFRTKSAQNKACLEFALAVLIEHNTVTVFMFNIVKLLALKQSIVQSVIYVNTT